MEKRKLNDKGFSLVELIIVIAIMAVLIGVLAPVYIQYLDRANRSADVSAVADMMNAMETTLIDKAARGETDADGITVTFASTGVASIDPDITNIIPAYTLKGGWTALDGGIVATYSGGAVTFAVTSGDHIITEMRGDYSNINDKF